MDLFIGLVIILLVETINFFKVEKLSKRVKELEEKNKQRG